ncbi:hypothetical protein CkaCkLH20_03094 [Colletotrichum karsti]|uniref:Uncharacterized protein n=1 Tax=Colletotrichum karsti TaxID=1095194 RepID=A0A9P6ICY2_9PEZI|nr:uncharacterized protein CkaCkLH20_03094 [Colletotrichum karsti]KAF9879551.1 hypothetical protein CkaCkLH20_03094 [Colletotrichum karsti]
MTGGPPPSFITSVVPNQSPTGADPSGFSQPLFNLAGTEGLVASSITTELVFTDALAATRTLTQTLSAFVATPNGTRPGTVFIIQAPTNLPTQNSGATSPAEDPVLPASFNPVSPQTATPVINAPGGNAFGTASGGAALPNSIANPGNSAPSNPVPSNSNPVNPDPANPDPAILGPSNGPNRDNPNPNPSNGGDSPSANVGVGPAPNPTGPGGDGSTGPGVGDIQPGLYVTSTVQYTGALELPGPVTVFSSPPEGTVPGTIVIAVPPTQALGGGSAAPSNAAPGQDGSPEPALTIAPASLGSPAAAPSDGIAAGDSILPGAGLPVDNSAGPAPTPASPDEGQGGAGGLPATPYITSTVTSDGLQFARITIATIPPRPENAQPGVFVVAVPNTQRGPNNSGGSVTAPNGAGSVAPGAIASPAGTQSFADPVLPASIAPSAPGVAPGVPGASAPAAPGNTPISQNGSPSQPAPQGDPNSPQESILPNIGQTQPPSPGGSAAASQDGSLGQPTPQGDPNSPQNSVLPNIGQSQPVSGVPIQTGDAQSPGQSPAPQNGSPNEPTQGDSNQPQDSVLPNIGQTQPGPGVPAQTGAPGQSPASQAVTGAPVGNAIPTPADPLAQSFVTSPVFSPGISSPVFISTIIPTDGALPTLILALPGVFVTSTTSLSAINPTRQPFPFTTIEPVGSAPGTILFAAPVSFATSRVLYTGQAPLTTPTPIATLFPTAGGAAPTIVFLDPLSYVSSTSTDPADGTGVRGTGPPVPVTTIFPTRSGDPATIVFQQPLASTPAGSSFVTSVLGGDNALPTDGLVPLFTIPAEGSLPGTVVLGSPPFGSQSSPTPDILENSFAGSQAASTPAASVIGQSSLGPGSPASLPATEATIPQPSVDPANNGPAPQASNGGASPSAAGPPTILDQLTPSDAAITQTPGPGTSFVDFSGSGVLTAPSTITTIAGSGTNPGLVIVATPALPRTLEVDYTGTSILDAPITLTTIPQVGTTPATVIIERPRPVTTIQVPYSGTLSLTAPTPISTIVPQNIADPITVVVALPALLSPSAGQSAGGGPQASPSPIAPISSSGAVQPETSQGASQPAVSVSGTVPQPSESVLEQSLPNSPGSTAASTQVSGSPPTEAPSSVVNPTIAEAVFVTATVPYIPTGNEIITGPIVLSTIQPSSTFPGTVVVGTPILSGLSTQVPTASSPPILGNPSGPLIDVFITITIPVAGLLLPATSTIFPTAPNTIGTVVIETPAPSIQPTVGNSPGPLIDVFVTITIPVLGLLLPATSTIFPTAPNTIGTVVVETPAPSSQPTLGNPPGPLIDIFITITVPVFGLLLPATSTIFPTAPNTIGTVVIETPASQTSFVTTTVLFSPTGSGQITGPTPLTTISPSQGLPGTVVVGVPESQAYVTTTVPFSPTGSQQITGPTPLTTIAPSQGVPGTVIIGVPESQAYVTTTVLFSPTGSQQITGPTPLTTIAPSLGLPGTVVIGVPESQAFVTTTVLFSPTGGQQVTGPTPLTTIAPSLGLPGTVVIGVPESQAFVTTTVLFTPTGGQQITGPTPLTTIPPSQGVPGTVVIGVTESQLLSVPVSSPVLDASYVSTTSLVSGTAFDQLTTPIPITTILPSNGQPGTIVFIERPSISAAPTVSSPILEASYVSTTSLVSGTAFNQLTSPIPITTILPSNGQPGTIVFIERPPTSAVPTSSSPILEASYISTTSLVSGTAFDQLTSPIPITTILPSNGQPGTIVFIERPQTSVVSTVATSSLESEVTTSSIPAVSGQTSITSSQSDANSQLSTSSAPTVENASQNSGTQTPSETSLATGPAISSTAGESSSVSGSTFAASESSSVPGSFTSGTGLSSGPGSADFSSSTQPTASSIPADSLSITETPATATQTGASQSNSILPGSYVTSEILYSPTGTEQITAPTTLSTILPSGQVPGTIIVGLPALFNTISVPYSGVGQITQPITLTTIFPTGTGLLGTVVVATPASSFVTSTEASSTTSADESVSQTSGDASSTSIADESLSQTSTDASLTTTTDESLSQTSSDASATITSSGDLDLSTELTSSATTGSTQSDETSTGAFEATLLPSSTTTGDATSSSEEVPSSTGTPVSTESGLSTDSTSSVGTSASQEETSTGALEATLLPSSSDTVDTTSVQEASSSTEASVTTEPTSSALDETTQASLTQSSTAETQSTSSDSLSLEPTSSVDDPSTSSSISLETETASLTSSVSIDDDFLTQTSSTEGLTSSETSLSDSTLTSAPSTTAPESTSQSSSALDDILSSDSSSGATSSTSESISNPTAASSSSTESLDDIISSTTGTPGDSTSQSSSVSASGSLTSDGSSSSATTSESDSTPSSTQDNGVSSTTGESSETTLLGSTSSPTATLPIETDVLQSSSSSTVGIETSESSSTPGSTEAISTGDLSSSTTDGVITSTGVSTPASATASLTSERSSTSQTDGASTQPSILFDTIEIPYTGSDIGFDPIPITTFLPTGTGSRGTVVVGTRAALFVTTTIGYIVDDETSAASFITISTIPPRGTNPGTLVVGTAIFRARYITTTVRFNPTLTGTERPEATTFTTLAPSGASQGVVVVVEPDFIESTTSDALPSATESVDSQISSSGLTTAASTTSESLSYDIGWHGFSQCYKLLHCRRADFRFGIDISNFDRPGDFGRTDHRPHIIADQHRR